MQGVRSRVYLYSTAAAESISVFAVSSNGNTLLKDFSKLKRNFFLLTSLLRTRQNHAVNRLDRRLEFLETRIGNLTDPVQPPRESFAVSATENNRDIREVSDGTGSQTQEQDPEIHGDTSKGN